METFLHRNGEQLGPYSLSVLRAMYDQGELSTTDLLWHADSQEWRPVPEFFQPTASAAPPPLPPLRQLAETESTIFQESGITVTKTRFVVGAQTFALAGITSVRGVEIPPSRTGPTVLLICGLLILVSWILYLGILMLIGAVVWLFFQKPTFSVVLTTAGGEVKAYNSPERDFIGRVIYALTQAIIARG